MDDKNPSESKDYFDVGGPFVPKSALVAMSGGVDSSVALLLSLRAGMRCVAGTLHLHSETDAEGRCGAAEDAGIAASIAASIGVDHCVWDVSGDFCREVIDRFADAYARGQTPNPCVECNRYMKFGKLSEIARERGLDCVVTGHFARVGYDPASGRWLLLRALDHRKDQSYVLFRLTQEQLAHTRFPLGGMTKDEVRALAADAGFPNADKHDSQDICFVPGGDYESFLRRYTGKPFPPGDYVDAEGRVLGRHRGIIRYTIGQHKGLGLSTPEPLYVTALDTPNNRVMLGKNEDLFSRTLIAHDVNLISVPSIPEPMRVTARVRYRHEPAPALAWQEGEDELRVLFDQPQRAITPGQSVVLYDGDVVVGGGRIDGI